MNSLGSKGAHQNHSYLSTLRSDTLNLCETWLWMILYNQNLYPQQSFEFRCVHGIQVPVSTSRKVKQYIDNFFKQIQDYVGIINKVEIVIKDNGEDFLKYGFLIDFPQTEAFFSRHQKQTQFKYFLSNLAKSFKSDSPINGKNRTFELFVEYRYENDNSQKVKTGKFIDNWIKDQTGMDEQISNDKYTILGKSLQLPDFSVLCERTLLK